MCFWTGGHSHIGQLDEVFFQDDLFKSEILEADLDLLESSGFFGFFFFKFSKNYLKNYLKTISILKQDNGQKVLKTVFLLWMVDLLWWSFYLW